jgi:predicted amidohydrolase
MSSLQKKVRIAAVQMISGPKVEDNLAEAGRWIAEAARQGAQLVALPEYFPIISDVDADRVKAREVLDHGPIQLFLAGMARNYKVWIIGGSIPLEASVPDKLRNSCLVYSPDGERVARYDKIHLFGFEKGSEKYNESAFIEAGDAPVAIDTPLGRIALSICYDLRFPELYRQLGKRDGVDAPLDLIVVPAAFTETTGRAHWEILLRARAIENQCYVMAIGQGGVHPNGRETHGNSMIIDPWGTILDRKLKGAGLVIAELDHALIADTRSSLPALKHRRLG